MLTQKPGLLDQIRDRFAHVESCPLTGPRIFFENAGGALTLKTVVETSATFAAIPDNQGRDNPASKELVRVIDEAKAAMRVFLNAPDGHVFVGESGTEILFRLIRTAAGGAAEGGTLLGSTLEHPASRSAMAHWAERSGRSHVLVPHDDASGTVGVDAYRRHLTPDLRVATILHTSPVTGMAVAVAEIAEAIREAAPDCLIIVDGIQHASHGHIDIASYGIDGYAISPYKVFSRHGYGIGWASERLTALPKEQLLGGPAANWELGTRDTGSYATFSDVVDYFAWLGRHFTGSSDRRQQIEAAAAAIHAHEKDLTDAMLFGSGNLKGLTELPGVTIIGGAENPAREGLVALMVDGLDSGDLVSALREEGIRVHIRKNDHYSGNILDPLGQPSCIRVSLCHYNSQQEVAQFLAAMADILGEHKAA
ncbi:aminotransferase class V-fold PLP-dependent enzyme [Pelagibius sp.]|uniref:aminotransferase class V-fold PLP-dependent enzyme n=1 Tax=Pelagibius sp. TaxID=1931238 RepID=UPI00263881A1|nr:aminotransferase class V-fold PLP-dependent enzyme [Pelagibius sp.]